MPIIYPELRRLASAHMARESRAQTLSPTDLVSEAYLRLAQPNPGDFQDRAHFFAVAARYMREILVDRARRRHAAKRGGLQRPVTLDENLFADERPEALVALDDALSALAVVDEQKARAIEMRYFAGMTHDDIAAVLQVSSKSVMRALRVAESWLRAQLRDVD
jgi:RNA polymerase sigma factor (TIGR02999 family)